MKHSNKKLLRLLYYIWKKVLDYKVNSGSGIHPLLSDFCANIQQAFNNATNGTPEKQAQTLEARRPIAANIIRGKQLPPVA